MTKYSIKDIAKISGVSVATVSRVINNNGRFSEETRQKVLKVIKETGYQMNYSAKSLRMKRSFTIGIVVPDITNYFFNQLVQQIEEILFDKNFSTIICNTSRNVEKENNYLQMLQNKGVDGIIVISGIEQFHFNNPKIPYICIDREPKNKSETIFISSNHYQGGFDAAETLIKYGSKHPVIALHSRLSSSSKNRLEGFKDALRKNNLIFDEQTSIISISSNDKNYQNSLNEYFIKNLKTDGIFATSDFIAHEILQFLKNKGIEVPKKIKLIGFDDNPIDNYLSPKLSSVHQNIGELAQLAVSKVLELLDGKKADLGKSITIPVTVKVRDSIITIDK